MPEISIVTAAYIDTYDKMIWLGEMIKSVQAQTFQNWELVLVDDASPVDLGGLKVECYGDSRMRWFRCAENTGVALARNTGVALAEAEAILPFDADDLLPEEALAVMYAAWQVDHSRIVYGNLQRITAGGEKGTIYDLPAYTFQKALDLKGVMPVAALHSRECHVKAGGWKQELKHGLEDVEYWIAAGKASFCGYKISNLTLLYRKHETSRHARLQANRLETQMNNLIIDLHRDVYEGRYPMGCCGGGGGAYVPPQNQQKQMNISTPLEGFRSDEKIWVQYLGKRQGAFDMVGTHTGRHYSILSPGHKFEIHILDAPKFRQSGRGQDFMVGTAPPVDTQPVLVEIPAEAGRFVAPAPVLARIERLDEIAAQSRGTVLPPETPANGVSLINSISGNHQAQTGQQDFDLSPLGLAEKIQRTLEMESWSIQKLAGASPDDLVPYPGIGPTVAGRIIQTARSYLNV